MLSSPIPLAAMAKLCATNISAALTFKLRFVSGQSKTLLHICCEDDLCVRLLESLLYFAGSHRLSGYPGNVHSGFLHVCVCL